MIAHPRRRKSPILDVVRNRIGPRPRISRSEMRDLLAGLDAAGLVEADNIWAGGNPADSFAARWTASCTGITVISVLADTDPQEARWASSNPGTIRYDAPGSMHPQLRATLMFATASCCSRRETLEYLRDRAQRLLIVDDQ